jgi:hypothetical protein
LLERDDNSPSDPTFFFSMQVRFVWGMMIIIFRSFETQVVCVTIDPSANVFLSPFWH